MGLGPFDLTGGPFLVLYVVLLALTIAAGVAIPRWLRPEGHERRVTEPDQLAYLAGGATRYVDALVARMLAAGSLAIEGKAAFRIAPTRGLAAASERGVLALSSPAKWSAVQLAAGRGAPAVEQALVGAGQLIDRGTAFQLRLWQTLPYGLLLLFGATKWEIGQLRDRPTGFLTALLLVTAVLALIRFAVVDRRTRGGMASLGQARTVNERLRRAPVANETGMAVALFGTAILAGSAWSSYHTLRSSGSDGGSSSSDGGSSGCGGGGGGGGCGGCGS